MCELFKGTEPTNQCKSDLFIHKNKAVADVVRVFEGRACELEVSMRPAEAVKVFRGFPLSHSNVESLLKIHVALHASDAVAQKINVKNFPPELRPRPTPIPIVIKISP